MNASLLNLEFSVLALALGILLLDLWTPPPWKRRLGYVAALGLCGILAWSFSDSVGGLILPHYAFGHAYILDGLSLFFKRFFLVAGIMVLFLAVEFSDRIETGIAEFYSLTLFALTGMLLAASANDFTMLFVAVELITISFYVLTSFQRRRLLSLEAGLKYLILGALSTALTVYGIALVYGTSGTMSFEILAKATAKPALLGGQPLFLLGLLLVLAGLGFKIAAFPMQIWAPDVYQGSPTPATAFLAIGSKAAGFVLLLRLLFAAVPSVTAEWVHLLIVISALTILYGNLCAIPQRNLKRLLGYSSIAQAGYLLMGVAAMASAVHDPVTAGAAILYYLGGYLFTVLAAFGVLILVMRKVEAEDITALAGLSRRSPLLATTMTLAMVSLAGVPPLAGFFGKFLLLKAALEQGAPFYGLVGIALAGVVISIWYYFGVIRAIYWSQAGGEQLPIVMTFPTRVVLYVCVGGMLFLGVYPAPLVKWSTQAVSVWQAPSPGPVQASK